MPTSTDTIQELALREYKYGFVSDIEADSVPKGPGRGGAYAFASDLVGQVKVEPVREELERLLLAGLSGEKQRLGELDHGRVQPS